MAHGLQLEAMSSEMDGMRRRHEAASRQLEQLHKERLREEVGALQLRVQVRGALHRLGSGMEVIR